MQKDFGVTDHYKTVSEYWPVVSMQMPKTFGAMQKHKLKHIA